MRIILEFENQTEKSLIGYKKLFTLIALTTLEQINFKNEVMIAVTIVNDETIQVLNQQHRGKNKPTDVLSFPQYEFKEGKAPATIEKGIILPLGDIVISHPTAKRQARAYQHRLKRELSFLFVHGLLHLLGFDHEKLADEKKMFSLQEEILNQIGITRIKEKTNG